MKNTHTPGPWQVYNGGAIIGTIEYASGVEYIANVRHIPNESMANARLLASAPDMFDALQAIVDAYGERDTLLMAQVKAALAKAKGEA
jgi:hypothetical protein